MYKSKSYFIIFMIIAAMIGVAACSSAPAGTATVSINTGLGSSKGALTKAPAPEEVTSIYIEVMGGDMEPVSGVVILSGINTDGNPVIPADLQSGMENYNIVPVTYDSATGSLTLSVPAGIGREFVLIAATLTPEIYYMGTTTADLFPDAVNNVQITMAIYTGGFAMAALSAELLLSGQPFFEILTTLKLYTGMVEITGPDIPAITQPFMPGYPNYAPVGSLRTFKITIKNIDPSDPGVVLAWEGKVTADVLPDNNTVQVDMKISETKIVVPDYLNSRVVQIDNFSTPNWISKVGMDFNISLGISPYDIDFDSLGRIYILNNTTELPVPKIIRIDNINSTTPDPIIGTGTSTQYTAIAIDRNTNYLYYATNLLLFRTSLDVILEEPLPASIINNIRGIAVDDSGMLYIACSIISTPGVVSYNPSTKEIINSSAGLVTMSTPYDVIVKSPYVYVVDAGSSNVIQLPLDLSKVTATLFEQQGGGDSFSVPSRFVAILNKKFHVLDDGHLSGVPPYNNDRIISFDEIDGTGWLPYGGYGTGEGQFEFYSHFIC